MKVCLKCVLKFTLLLVVLVILVVIGYVLYVCVDYNRIEDNVKLSVNKASSEEAAIDAATEWFSERTPTMHVAIDNKAEPETEID